MAHINLILAIQKQYDPDLVQRITGLKTCNLAEGVTILWVVGSRFPLDAYLENNKRPRYLPFTVSMFYSTSSTTFLYFQF